MTIQARNGFTADVHEFLITPQGDALFLATKVVKADLTSYGGVKNGSYVDFEIQEINPRTGKLVFAWDVGQHVPLSASIVPPPTTSDQVWDAYHLNSIDLASNGALLISARDLWTVFEISNPALPGGGQILWQLGGKRETEWPQLTVTNDITGPYHSAFQWQHDAQFQPVAGSSSPGQLQISLFDDACCESPYPDPFSPAQGEILNLDFTHLTASVLKTYPHDPSLYPNSQGDVEALSNGDEFLGWGAKSYYSEYTRSGNVLYDVLMPGADISYRTYRDTWVGLPLTKPAAAVRVVNGSPVVYASWNGSTQTVAWRLLAGPTPRALAPVSTTSRTGFETALQSPTMWHYYKVQALDAQGHVLGTSRTLRFC